MKKINLRELYPNVYTTDFFVDVTEEVMETIRAASPKKWQQKTPDFRGGKLARQEQPLLY